MAVYASPQASPYRGRLLTCVVLLLDDTEQMFQIPVSCCDASDNSVCVAVVMTLLHVNTLALSDLGPSIKHNKYS